MKIIFESYPYKYGFPFRVIGYEGRYDTLSDCDFIDDSRIICVDRQMAILYLIHFDLSNNSHAVLNSKECIIDGKPQHCELLSFRNSTLYSVTYHNTLFSCTIENNKFTNLKSTVVRQNDNYHGLIALENSDSVLVTNMNAPTITEYNTKTEDSTTISCSTGVRIKDVAVLDEDHLIALSSDSGPISGKRLSNGRVLPRCNLYNSHILVLNRKNGRLLNKYLLENTQIDGCTYDKSYCYVTCTEANGSGFILRFKLDCNYNFTDIIKIPCAGFPHGIAIYNDLISYTSYTESALFIHKLTDFISSSYPL